MGCRLIVSTINRGDSSKKGLISKGDLIDIFDEDYEPNPNSITDCEIIDTNIRDSAQELWDALRSELPEHKNRSSINGYNVKDKTKDTIDKMFKLNKDD